MGDYPYRKLGELCSVLSSKRIFAKEYVEHGVPFYRSKEIIQKHNGENINTELFISEERFGEIEKKYGAPRASDMLMTSVGTLGVSYIVTDSERFYFKDGNLTWYKDFSSELNSKYLYYLFDSTMGKDLIKSVTIGSSQAALTIDGMKNLEVPCPDILIQEKIVHVLSTYDNLIKNNNRRIAILEEMAQKLYREWFVHFRFPGHENVKMVESEMGLIPKGWQWQPLFDVADIQYGFAFKSKLFCDDSSLNPVVRIRDILGNRTQTYSPEKPDKRYLICNGDILIGMDGIFHMNQWSGGRAYLNQRVVKLVSKAISTLQLFYALKPVISHLEATISGTTVAHLSDADMKKVMVLVADDSIQMQANKLLQPWLQEKVILQQKNTNLRKTRDLLLPRLISGDMDVSDLDIPTKEG